MRYDSLVTGVLEPADSLRDELVRVFGQDALFVTEYVTNSV